MDQMTQRNAGMVQDSALAAQRLSKQSAHLSEHVVRFVIGAGDATRARATESSAAGPLARPQGGARSEAAWT